MTPYFPISSFTLASSSLSAQKKASPIRRVFLCFLSLWLAACQPNVKDDTQTFQDDQQGAVESVKQPSITDLLEPNCYPDEAFITFTPEPDAWRTLDLWDRIRHGYALDLNTNRRVQQHQSWFAKHPEYLERVLLRGQRYLYHIVQELEARQMPLEIAFLPIVESAFDPFAYSPGRASGMWQIIPGTGKMLGLKQGWWYDGRRDAIASTDAALNYLEYLRGRFDGDWLLALAAYNSGAGTVNRAIRKNKQKTKPTDFWHLDLPRETRDYVPKLIALARIFRAPSNFGITLVDMRNEPYFAAVEIDGQIDLAQAAMLAEMDMQAFYELNSGFNRWATDPDGPHSLILPIDRIEKFKSGLSLIPPNQRVKWQRHAIKRGETLSHIAAKYGISVNSLQSINRLRGTTIREGKTLMVPMAQKRSSHYALSADQRLQRKQQTGAKLGKTRLEYIVQPGDSFWNIGRTHKVSSGQVAKWNSMAPRDTLRIGQTLVIWVDDRKVQNTSVNKQTLPITLPPQNQKVIRKLSYRVRQGDSLYKIASKFEVAVSDIVRWNAINEQRYLQPGQSLVLFVDVKS